MTDHPPYTITPEILNRVAAISEVLGRLTVLTDPAKALRNRVRTIHGSLAIEVPLLPPPSRGTAQGNEGRDETRGPAMAAWSQQLDGDGTLSGFFKPAMLPGEYPVAQLEGWILGVGSDRRGVVW